MFYVIIFQSSFGSSFCKTLSLIGILYFVYSKLFWFQNWDFNQFKLPREKVSNDWLRHDTILKPTFACFTFLLTFFTGTSLTSIFLLLPSHFLAFFGVFSATFWTKCDTILARCWDYCWTYIATRSMLKIKLRYLISFH